MDDKKSFIFNSWELRWKINLDRLGIRGKFHLGINAKASHSGWKYPICLITIFKDSIISFIFAGIAKMAS